MRRRDAASPLGAIAPRWLVECGCFFCLSIAPGCAALVAKCADGERRAVLVRLSMFVEML